MENPFWKILWTCRRTDDRRWLCVFVCTERSRADFIIGPAILSMHLKHWIERRKGVRGSTAASAVARSR